MLDVLEAAFGLFGYFSSEVCDALVYELHCALLEFFAADCFLIYLFNDFLLEDSDFLFAHIVHLFLERFIVFDHLPDYVELLFGGRESF